MQILHRKGQTSKPKLAIAQGEQAWGEGHGGPCSAFVLLRRCPLLNSAWICWFAFDTALSCFFFFGICQCFSLLQLILHRSLTVCARFHWSPALAGARARGGNNWGRWVSSRSRLLRNRHTSHMIKQYQTCLLRMHVVSSWRALNKQDARPSWASLLRPCWVTWGYTALHGTRLDCGMKRWATCELNEEQMMGLLLLEDFCWRTCVAFCCSGCYRL